MSRETKKNLVRVVLIVLAIVLIFGCSRSVEDGELVSTAIKENDEFSVKISAFIPKAAFGPTGWIDYVVKSKLSDGDWIKVFIEQHDDLIKFGKDNIVFVDSSASLVFVSTRYAVTVDKGQSWREFDIKRDDLSCQIKSVKLNKDATGSMTLICNQEEKQLFTKDFGINWSKR